MTGRFKPLLPYVARYQARLLLLAGCMALATLCEGIGIGLFLPLLEFVQHGEAFLTRGTFRPFFEAWSRLGLEPSAGLFVAAIFAAVVATLALKRAVVVTSAKVCNPLIRDLREEAFRRSLAAHLLRFYAGSSGRFVQKVEDDAEHLGQALNFAILLAVNCLSLAVYAGMMLLLSWKLTLLVAFLAGLRYGVSTLFILKSRRLGEECVEMASRLKSVLIGVHQGIDVIKSFGTEVREEEAFRGLARRIEANATAITKNAASSSFFEGLLGDGALCLLVYLSVSRLGVSGAALLTFLVVISRTIPKVSAVNDARIRIAEYLSRVAALPEALSSGGLPPLRWGSRPKPDFKDRVAFEDAGFSYPGATAPALAGIRLDILKNETLAVVGSSGAGKTTLARLLLRLFDPDSGRVTIDGMPLGDIRREDWTRLVTLVGQDAFIFDDTLENNVKYGAPDCAPEAFHEALRRARALEFVGALPERERTRLGERGAALSGGQRQRIAIARAFLRDAPILVLDEATSAVDAVTEKLIQDSIVELSKDRTVVVIAHRFTTIRDADRIVVLEGGRIAESGTHEELMGNDRLYSRFHSLQLRQ